MAHVTALAAARHRVLERAGWDFARDGLQGAPRIRVIVGEERHVTVDRALRYLGIGERTDRAVPADGQGRMRVELLPDALAGRRRADDRVRAGRETSTPAPATT